METRKVSELKPNRLNPRGDIGADDALRELAASIREKGVLQPLLITPGNVIIAGHRRHAAAVLARVESVPVAIKEMSESEQVQVMLVENLQREGLSVLQTVKAYRLLLGYGLKVPEIAKAIGISKAAVKRYVDVLSLPPEIHMCFDGEDALPLTMVPGLLRLSGERQIEVAEQALNNRWTLKHFRYVLQTMDGGRSDQ